MRQVFSNAVILEGGDLEVTRGYLVVEGRKIKKISEGSPPGRATDLKGGIILPPFINAHTHVGDTVGKEMYLGKPQPEVVGPGGVKFKVMASSPTRKTVSSIRATLKDMVRTGTSVHCDFRENGLAGLKLLKKAAAPGLRTLTLGRGETVEETREVLKKADGIGLPSISSFSLEELQEISQRTNRKHKLLSLHAAETEEAQELSVKNTGKGEIQRALELKPSFIVHATHGSTDDLKRLAKEKVPVVFCPRSNQLLSVGTPPINKAMELGVDFWLGTDNVMVAQPDMFEELRFAWAVMRREDHGVGKEESRQLLTAATTAPAEKLGVRGGAIYSGGGATFLILSRKNNLQDISDIHAGIVNRARADNIRSFFLSGKAIF
jgi:cytosine/adenosine deaminase-related metal-dependent hydrolase